MYRLNYSQKLPIPLKECWDFFSSPMNLKVLTPPHLNFKILSALEEKGMYSGQLIEYFVHPVLGIPIYWMTEITSVETLNYFIDEQRFGPYKFWHHEHRFREIPGGVEVEDIIHYKMPFGPLGKCINALKVRKDLEKIFSYRKAKLETLFGIYANSSGAK